jgi:hypothetical protein
MGLSKSALRFLLEEHRRSPIRGSVLTLGRQNVYATLDEVRSLFARAGVAAPALPAGVAATTNIPSWIGTPKERNTSDVAFFRMLGASDVLALDHSAFEGAELVWDLNEPIPPDFADRFDFILDGGTLEHVFNTRQALVNVGKMLRVHGRVVHMSPTSNYVNHGFYQFSPTLFFDFYEANRFSDLSAAVVEHNVYLPDRPWRVRAVGPTERVVSSLALLTVFVARRTIESSTDRIPTQTFYRLLGGAHERPAGRPSGWRQWLWGRFSDQTRRWILGSVPLVDRIRQGRWHRL